MKDRFSRHASQYAAFRPVYPQALYHFILDHTNDRSAAWDCGCGNGQVARDLAPHFTKIFATDISQKQIDNAFVAPNIHYAITAAERTAFADNSFDLITVGQAIHWFKIQEFFREAARVGKKGATLAYWGYSLFRVASDVDRIVDDFYTRIIGPYWDSERKLIDQQYRSIDFPFPRIEAPSFDFSFDWSIGELEGYINTWSAVQNFITARGVSPVGDLCQQLGPFWANGRRKVTFPLFLTVGIL